MIVRAEGLTKDFASASVLHGISLHVDEGEFVVLIGPNGCGKTVLLKILCGLLPPTSGRVVFEAGGPGGVTMAFQRSPLFPWMTVRENLLFSLNAPAETAPRRDEEVARWIADSRLSEWADHYPHQISGGIRQKANVVRSLMGVPRLALMDEPFAALDYLERRRLQGFLADLQRSRGTATLLVTHDIPEAIFLADRILVMRRTGKVEAEFTVPFPKPRAHEALQRQAAYSDLYEKISGILSRD